MAQQSEPSGVLAVQSLREYFHGALQDAMAHLHLSVQGQTEQYVVNLLTLFARSEALYAGSEQRRGLKPLAQLLGEALEAPTAQERERTLQWLGDVSLFIAGFFTHSFARRLVDADYHIAMGGRAYATLANTHERGRRRVLGEVFAELAAKFQPLTDALAEISEQSRQDAPQDVLRLYELWLKTGSARARQRLGALGIVPAPIRWQAH